MISERERYGELERNKNIAEYSFLNAASFYPSGHNTLEICEAAVTIVSRERSHVIASKTLKEQSQEYWAEDRETERQNLGVYIIELDWLLSDAAGGDYTLIKTFFHDRGREIFETKPRKSIVGRDLYVVGFSLPETGPSIFVPNVHPWENMTIVTAYEASLKQSAA